MSNLGNNILFTIAVLGVAAIHSVVSFFTAFVVGISPSNETQALRIFLNIIAFPLPLLPSNVTLPAPFNWLIWITLSLAWGLGICLLIRAIGEAASR